MAFLYTPTYNPTSASRPIQWTARVITALAVETATVEVYIDSNLQATFTEYPDISSSGTNWIFKIDIQQIVRDYLSPKAESLTSTFGNGVLSVPYAQISPGVTAALQIIVTYSYRDATTNELVNLGVTDTSSTIYTMITARQHNETMSLQEFEPTFNSNRRWLTNLPKEQPICEDENYYLSYQADAAANHIRIRTYTSAGTLIEQGVFTVDTSLIYEVQTIGVGMANLRTQVYDFSGAVDIDDPDMAYYTVELVGFADVFKYLEIFTFNKVSCCGEKRFRVHYLNVLGGVDAYTFNSKLSSDIANNNNQAQKPLTWNGASATPHSLSDKGVLKINQTAVNGYNMESGWLKPEQAAALGELVYSPEVYLETTDGFLPIFVEATATPIKDSTKAAVIMSLRITEANDILTQQY